MRSSIFNYKMHIKRKFAVFILVSTCIYAFLFISMHGDITYIVSRFITKEHDALPHGNIKDIYKENLLNIPTCNDPKLYYLTPDNETSEVTRSGEVTIFRTHVGYCKLKTPERPTLFHNLCLSKDKYFDSAQTTVQAFFTSYDSRINGNNYLFSINGPRVKSDHDKEVNYWQVTGRSSPVQQEKDNIFQPSVLLFSPFLDKNYSFDQMHHWVLPQLHQTLERLKDSNMELEYGTKKDKKPPLVTLVVPTFSDVPSPLSQAYTYLGFNKIVQYKDLTSKEPFCFKWAIFAAAPVNDVEMQSQHLGEVTKTLVHNWPKRIKCKSYHVLFVTRTTSPRIIDLAVVVEMFETNGYENTKVIQMEDQTFRQQFELIRCTSVLVGFQGDALALYAHLPTNASVIEFVHVGYPSEWWQRIQDTRTDLNKYTLQCETDIRDRVWQKYARQWFNHPGSVDTKLKLKIIQKSRKQWPTGESIFKESNSLCAVTPFFNQLPKLDDFQRKGKEIEAFAPFYRTKSKKTNTTGI